MSSPIKCFCSHGSTDCPPSGWKTCDPDVTHCLLSLQWKNDTNSLSDYIQDCWHWTDNYQKIVRCPDEIGVCKIMSEFSGYRTCCCLGDYCNNRTNMNFTYPKESLTSTTAVTVMTTPVTTDAADFGSPHIILLVVMPILAVVFVVVLVALICYILSIGFRMKKLTLFPGINCWYRCLPLKRNGSRQQVDGDAGGSIPLNNQRDRRVTGHSWPTDDEIEGLTSLVTKIRLKSQGCFGQVWLGHKAIKDETCEERSLEIRGKLPKLPNDVAIKVFPANHETSWLAEVALFRLPGLPHPNILRFYGADKNHITSDDGLSGGLINSLEYWLVTEYHPHGSIYDYIRVHTIDWNCLLGIAVGIARGLSHLHFEAPTATALAAGNGDNGCQNGHHVPGKTGVADSVGLISSAGEVAVGSCWKPVIAHRDLNSRNILLKSDMTACIADFGLAIQFEPGHLRSLAHPKLGTRRYMAPEVLDGAIQFSRDAYLRIDVYAMGLVFWELMSRCVGDVVRSSGDINLISLAVDEPYRAPYELELGPNPTMEEMQRLVAFEKYRPKFDPRWSEHTGMCNLRETVEECWDQDAEARLSAGCVAERLTMLSQHPSNYARSLNVPWTTTTTTTVAAAGKTSELVDHTGDTSSSLTVFRSDSKASDSVSALRVSSYLQSTSISPPPPTVSLTSSPLLEDVRLRALSVQLNEDAVDDQHQPLIRYAISYPSSVPSRSANVCTSCGDSAVRPAV